MLYILKEAATTTGIPAGPGKGMDSGHAHSDPILSDLSRASFQEGACPVTISVKHALSGSRELGSAQVTLISNLALVCMVWI